MCSQNNCGLIILLKNNAKKMLNFSDPIGVRIYFNLYAVLDVSAEKIHLERRN